MKTRTILQENRRWPSSLWPLSLLSASLPAILDPGLPGSYRESGRAVGSHISVFGFSHISPGTHPPVSFSFRKEPCVDKRLFSHSHLDAFASPLQSEQAACGDGIILRRRRPDNLCWICTACWTYEQYTQSRSGLNLLKFDTSIGDLLTPLGSVTPGPSFISRQTGSNPRNSICLSSEESSIVRNVTPAGRGGEALQLQRVREPRNDGDGADENDANCWRQYLSKLLASSALSRRQASREGEGTMFNKDYQHDSLRKILVR